MTEVEIALDQYKLTIEVSRLVSDKPDPSCRDSADDARGTREIEWRIVYAIEYDENNKVQQCGELPWWLNKLANDFDKRITAALWAKYDEAQDNRHDHR